MRSHVALLRGINLGRHNRLAMADLRQVAASLGLADIATYIRSGNLVFSAPGREPISLAADLEARIAERIGVRPAVIVLTRTELVDVFADNPYPQQTDPTCVHVVFFAQDPGPEAAATLTAAEAAARAKGSRDAAVLGGRVMYLHTPDGLGRSRLAEELNRPRAVRAPAPASTMRNLATVARLVALLTTEEPPGAPERRQPTDG